MENFLIIFKNHLFMLCMILIFSYLIGGINFSILSTKRLYAKEDIRTMGSGNAGFTNVLRSVGKVPAIVTFVGDFAKGVLAVGVSEIIAKNNVFWGENLEENKETLMYLAFLSGFACVIGHIYPCFFGFRGGKGILTGWSITLLMDKRIFFTVIFVFLVLLVIGKIVSFASIFAAASYPIATFAFYYKDFSVSGGNIYYVLICTAIAFLTALLVILKHKSNILRLISGTEKRISLKN